MLYKKITPLYVIINIFVFFAVVIFHSSFADVFTIKSATPMLLLPLITAFAFYHSSLACLGVGLICGAVVDSVSAGSYCFNTILFIVLATVGSRAANSLFNKNIKAAAVAAIISSSFYFISSWLVFYAFGSTLEDSLGYILSYGLPSAIYSALFIFPFYYIFKVIEKIKYK